MSLDTHTFIWLDDEPEKLSPRVQALCQDPATELFLSVASAWEIQIKVVLGKLAVRVPLHQIIEQQEKTNGLQVLPVTLEHVWGLDRLPPHHKDPFDRLLIAQALVEGLTLASVDQQFAAYPVPVIW